MGFKNDNGGSGSYVKVIDGKLVMRVPEGTKGAEPREIKEGKNAGDTIYEMKYTKYSGFLKKAWIKADTGYGRTLNLKMSDGVDVVTITVNLTTAHAKRFMNICTNIDLDKELELSTFKLQKKDKDGKPVYDKFNHGWTVKQDDEAVPNKFSREDVPDMVKVKFKGKETWDDTDQLEFLIKNFEEWREEVFSDDNYREEKEVTKSKTKSSSKKDDGDDDGRDDLDYDDIPF